MARQTDTYRQGRKPRPNPLDAAGITYIDYKDTDLLRKFISDRGKIRSSARWHVRSRTHARWHCFPTPPVRRVAAPASGGNPPDPVRSADSNAGSR
jgi:ribosomal protein S18